MIQNRSVLAIIPARGGSKGVLHKNIRLVGGKPLISWTIEEAAKSKYIDRTIVSTDDPAIAETAKQWGGEVPFMRPEELAMDDTPGIAPVLHALDELKTKYDLVVLLQPTSPMRSVADIDGCIERLLVSNSNSCVSVVVPDKSPYWMYRINENDFLSPLFEETFHRRQDIPPLYALNGAVYTAMTEWLLLKKSFISEDTVAYVMPFERSLDIDTEIDMEFFSFLHSKS